MDVVTHSCPIRGIIVVTIHLQYRDDPDCHFLDNRHQIVRDILGRLTDEPTLVSPDRVEVAQGDDFELAIGLGFILEYLLNPGFGLSVRGEWLDGGSLLSMALVTVDSGGAREYKFITAIFTHSLENADGALDILAVVQKRELDRLPDCLAGCEVDDPMWLHFLEESIDFVLITHIYFFKW